MVTWSLRMDVLCDYTKATPSSRNMIDTSVLTSDAHIITGTLVIRNVFNTDETENFVEIVQMHCNFKAGSSHSCKHVVAILLF